MGRSNKKPLEKTISKANYTAGPVDGLPEEWRVEIRTCESGNHAGSKYKVGTERKDALDGLPPGWTVDMRVRKSGPKHRYDPYYTDPGNEYVFRSKKRVLLYLKTGKLGKYARRTDKLKQPDIITSCSKSDEAVNNEPKLDVQLSISDESVYDEPKSDAQLSKSDESVNNEPKLDAQLSKSDEAVNYKPKLDAQLSKSDEAVNGEPVVELSAIGGGNMELSGPFPLNKKNSKERKGKKVTIADGNVLRKKRTIESRFVETSVEDHERRKTQTGSRKRKKVELDTPRRVSKRLAGVATGVVSVMEKPSGTHVDAVEQPPKSNPAFDSTRTDVELAPARKRPNVTPHTEAAEQTSEVELIVDSTGTNGELASGLEGPDVTLHIEAAEQTPEAELEFNSTGTKGELASDLEVPIVTPHIEAAEKTPEAEMAVNFTGTNSELASDLEIPNTTRDASVEPPSGAELAVSLTSVDFACLVSAELDKFEPEKAGTCAADPLTGEIHLKQDGSQVTTTTCTSGGEAYYVEQGTSDTRREEQTTQSQPFLDLVTSEELDIKTQADGYLGEPFVSPFEELWTDPCLEFAYKTLKGDILVDNGEAITISNTILVSDPCIEFGYNTLTGAIPVGADPSTACLDAIPMSDLGDILVDNGEVVTVSSTIPVSDPCIEFVYNTLTGAIPVGDNLSTACPNAIPVSNLGDIPVDNGQVVTVSSTIPLSDPWIDFAYITLPGEIPMGDNPSTSFPDVSPLDDPCIEFAYKTLTGALPGENIPPVDYTDAVPTSDPCVEFAYKTLTDGIPTETPATVEKNQAVPVPVLGPGPVPVENVPPVIFTDAVPTSDPCIEFGYMTLTGGIPIETPARVENDQAVPIPDPLADPCFEFACKTLTGEIPLEESLSVRHFLQPESSAQTLNNSFVDGFFGSVSQPTSSVRAFPNETSQCFSNNVHSQYKAMDSKWR